MSLDDSTATAKTFKPVKVESSMLTFMSPDYNTESATAFAARPVLTVSNRLPSKQNDNYKVSLRLKMPSLEGSEFDTGTGTSKYQKVAYVSLANVDIVIPSLATALERADLLAFVKAALDNAQVVSTIDDMLLPN
jgi:hypothetical protein